MKRKSVSMMSGIKNFIHERKLKNLLLFCKQNEDEINTLCKHRDG